MKTNRKAVAGDNSLQTQSAHVVRVHLSFAGVAALFCSSAIAALLLSGCTSTKAAEATEEAPTVSVQVGPVEVTKIQRKVIAEAVLFPKDQAAIVPKINAPVKKFFVDRGSVVHAGQLLAELENQDLAGAVTENRGGYQQAEAAYQGQLQKAEQEVKLAKEEFAAAQRVYDSRVTLNKEGAASAKDVDDAQVALMQARNQYELAEKQLDLKAAEGQLTAAKGKSESAAAQFGYAKITSPISGVVTDRPVYAGEMASAGSPIITVMDVSEVIAREIG